MVLGWIAEWLADPQRDPTRVKRVIMQRLEKNVCHHIWQSPYPIVCERFLWAAKSGSVATTGVPVSSRISGERKIPATCWRSARILPYGGRRPLPALFSSSIEPRFSEITVRSSDVLRLWPIGTSVLSRVPDDGTPPPARPRPGRKKGSGSYDGLDAPLLEEMRESILQKRAASVEAAARQVAHKAFGTAIEKSKRDRLAKRFRSKYGLDIARIRSDLRGN